MIEHDEGVVQGRTGRRAHEAETGLVRGVVERLAADQGWSGRT